MRLLSVFGEGVDAKVYFEVMLLMFGASMLGKHRSWLGYLEEWTCVLLGNQYHMVRKKHTHSTVFVKGVFSPVQILTIYGMCSQTGLKKL